MPRPRKCRQVCRLPQHDAFAPVGCGRSAQAVVIAGGSDVLIKIREGKLAGCRLVSIHGLDAELAGVKVLDSGDLAIGPLTTFHNVTFDPLVRAHVPVLGEAADMAGGPQLRAVGTIGGNVCNGVTSADTASTLMAFGAQMHVEGPVGWRVVPIDDWYKGVGKVDLRPAELLCRIVIPKANFEGWTGHYIKYAQRNAMDIATLGVSCLVKLSADKTVCEDVRLAFGVAAPTPIRSHTAEDGVRGLTVTEAAEQIGDLALQDINPRTSWRASREFRVQLVKELSGRALLEAARKGGAQV